MIAHRDVDREIREKDAASAPNGGRCSGTSGPQVRTFPSRTVADEESVEFGDLRLTAWDFGACESESQTVWLLDGGDNAFVGDLAFNNTHAYRMGTRMSGLTRSTGRGKRSPEWTRFTSATEPPPGSTSWPISAATC